MVQSVIIISLHKSIDGAAACLPSNDALTHRRRITMAKATAKKTVAKKFGIEVEMTLERDTKGTYVYKAEGDVAVTSLYIQRSHMSDGAPDTITVSIS
jgi:hypothetical protein